ncbi:MAG: hypothetical protein E7260_08955 [Lachnospiraceae bacterium]|nr:hypothetical protein [Lachnospiraceae bacterium]
MRTVTSAYAYCSGLYDMSIRNIGPGHIKDAMGHVSNVLCKSITMSKLHYYDLNEVYQFLLK